MAAAYSARQLGVPAIIVVPSVTPIPTVERLKDEGATVVVHGKVSISCVIKCHLLNDLQSLTSHFLPSKCSTCWILVTCSAHKNRI